jgi:uracil-DNA glycosylase
VQKGCKIPPSLKNIFKELERSLNYKYNEIGDLSNWAKQGVFLLNNLLTVREGQPLSHQYLQWETFTDSVIEIINKECQKLVFLLWGAKAQSKKKLIDTKKHYVLESVHPSPLSAYRGFLGNNHFAETNEILRKINKEPIDWSVK